MADDTYQAKTYDKQGAAERVVADGGRITVESGGIVNLQTGAKLQNNGVDMDLSAGIATSTARTTAQLDALVDGVAAGYKIARGVHQQAAATDTVVTGLTTVVAVIVSFRGAPTAKQAFVSGSIGTQAGAPAAGSIYINTWKSTYAAADDFSDNENFNWVAVGT